MMKLLDRQDLRLNPKEHKGVNTSGLLLKVQAAMSPDCRMAALLGFPLTNVSANHS